MRKQRQYVVCHTMIQFDIHCHDNELLPSEAVYVMRVEQLRGLRDALVVRLIGWQQGSLVQSSSMAGAVYVMRNAERPA